MAQMARGSKPKSYSNLHAERSYRLNKRLNAGYMEPISVAKTAAQEQFQDYSRDLNYMPVEKDFVRKKVSTALTGTMVVLNTFMCRVFLLYMSTRQSGSTSTCQG